MSVAWKRSNGYPQEVKRNNLSDFIAMIWSAKHFNFKHYSIEREVIWKKCNFQLKTVQTGEQNIQI